MLNLNKNFIGLELLLEGTQSIAQSNHWMYKRFSIEAAAKGEFDPSPPIEPRRTAP